MTDAERREAIRVLLKQYTKANTVTPQAAVAALAREGIYTSDGKLEPEFGGETEPPQLKRA